MNPALTLNQFEQLAVRDTAYLSMVQSVRGQAMILVKVLVTITLGPIVVLIAQFVPYIFKKHLQLIYPALPFINERKSLEWLRDTFQLYYFALKGYRTVAINRGGFDVLMEELDEHIDSISYVLGNYETINEQLKKIS